MSAVVASRHFLRKRKFAVNASFKRPKEEIASHTAEPSTRFQIIDEEGIQVLSFPDLKIENWDTFLEDERAEVVSFTANR